jgi:hypothetical protein
VRRVFLLLTALFSLLIVLTPASAQTPPASPDASPQASPASDTLPGLTYVAARQYAPDPSSPIDPESEEAYIVTVRIYAFDSEAHANAGWESTVESTTIESQVPAESDKVQYEEQDIEGLGDRAWATTLAAETPEGDTGYFRLIYVQEGAYLYTLNAIAGSADATTITDDIASVMVKGKPGEDAVQFNPDGTSTGGVWDLLPAADDEVLGQLIAFADAELVLDEE